MNDNELSGQERTDDERRAEWEQFTMVVLDGGGGGFVNVRNDSHENPGEHIHSVHVTDGKADDCSCGHATYRDAHCKHQVAVENRPLVVASADAASANTATTGQQVATDGGTVVETTDDTNDTDDEKTDHWDQALEHYDDDPVGAGESRQCQACGSRFEVALVAATAENSRRWEEFYRCQNCNAGGSFRVDETQPTREEQRTWTGMMAYPDE